MYCRLIINFLFNINCNIIGFCITLFISFYIHNKDNDKINSDNNDKVNSVSLFYYQVNDFYYACLIITHPL